MDGQTRTDLDAGYHVNDIVGPADARAGDRVWFDTDANGLQDAGEAGAANVAIALLDEAGAEVATTTTNSNGEFVFAGLFSENYRLRYTAPAGYQFTGQHQTGDFFLDSDADTAGLTDLFMLNGWEHDVSIDAGLVPTPGGPDDEPGDDEDVPVDPGDEEDEPVDPEDYGGTISDTVWQDQNEDGLQDVGEPGMSGITVNLLDASGIWLGTTVTDTAGHYEFADVPAGDYRIQVLLPAFYNYTQTNQGTDDTLDSDVDTVTGITAVFSLGEGQARTDMDAGLCFIDYADPGATLGDFVWNDLDADGIQEEGEPGFAGVTVNLLDASGTLLSSTTTNSVGFYEFADLAVGNYRVEFVAPAGYAFSPQDQGGNDALDSDADASGLTAVVGLNNATTNLDVDAGLRVLPVVTIGPGTQTVDEGLSGGITLSRSGGDIAEPLVVNLSFEANGAGDPLAAWGDDYVLTAPEFSYLGAGLATVTFAPNVTAVVLGVPTQTDILAEETEGVRVTVQDGGTAYQAGTAGDGTTADVRIPDAPVRLNLLADTNVDGVLNVADDALEDDAIGKLLFVNDDDDDADLVRDFQDAGAVAGEDDLALVKLHIPAGDDGLTARLTLTGDTAAVRLWSAPDRTGLISSLVTVPVGPDPTSVSVYVEGLGVGFVTLHLELLDAAGDPFVQNGAAVADDLKARVAEHELDVNDNFSTADADDGFWDYMPGYRGTTPVLSSGAFNATTPLVPQALHAIYNGLGSAAGVGKIVADLTDVSSYAGYAENKPDPGDLILGNIYDVSFRATYNNFHTSTNDGGALVGRQV